MSTLILMSTVLFCVKAVAICCLSCRQASARHPFTNNARHNSIQIVIVISSTIYTPRCVGVFCLFVVRLCFVCVCPSQNPHLPHRGVTAWHISCQIQWCDSHCVLFTPIYVCLSMDMFLRAAFMRQSGSS